MKKLRLILWEECNRNCPGCCNNDWNLRSLDVETNYSGYDMILLTGGEPMMDPLRVHVAINEIRKQNPTAKIIMYTAYVSDFKAVISLLAHLDGLTVTLHDPDDGYAFLDFDKALYDVRNLIVRKSLRLNVFEGVGLYRQPKTYWEVKAGMIWIKNCPLPTGEVLKRWRPA